MQGDVKMKITRARLTEIVKEELLIEAGAYGPTPDPDQGVEPDDAEMSEAVSNLENARVVIARAAPELLEYLDFVIAKVKDEGMYPATATEPYTVYEKETDTEE